LIYGPNVGDDASTGNMVMVRYADDIVVGFDREAMLGASGKTCANGCGSSR